MKQVISILFLLTILAQAFYMPVLSGYLEWKRDYLTDNYCINITKPELQCNASCYINELKAEVMENSEEEGAIESVVERPSITMTTPPVANLSDYSWIQNRKTLPDYVFHYEFTLPFNIFHPPIKELVRLVRNI